MMWGRRGYLTGFLVSCATAGLALPHDGQVVRGQASIDTQGTLMQIVQGSPRAIIDWGSFNLGRDEIVRFLQPDRSSAVLNRVVGRDPSTLLGHLISNGTLVLVNPNGILFGPGSVVDAGSFLASTLPLSNDDFMSGHYRFRWDGAQPMAAIVNQGTIRVGEGGMLTLASPLLVNEGLLVARRGTVNLAAGREVTLNPDGQGLLEIALPDGFGGQPQARPETVLLTSGQMSGLLAQLVPTGQVEAGEGQLLHAGSILAESGQVRLDSSQRTVNQGTIEVQGVGQDAGQVRVLSAGASFNLGPIDASATGAGRGGQVEISAPHVALRAPVQVGAESGEAGQLLLDPVDLHLVAAGGSLNAQLPTIGNATTSGGFDSVDTGALALTSGAVALNATRDILVDPNTAVLFPNQVDVTLTAGRNLTMGTNTSLASTHPLSTLTLITQTQDMVLQNLEFATVHLNPSRDLTLSGQLGLPGSPSQLTGTGRVTTLGNYDLRGSSANLDLTGTLSLRHQNVAGTISAGAANVTLQSGLATALSNSTISGAGAVNLTVTAQRDVRADQALLVDLPHPSSRATLRTTSLSGTGLSLQNATLAVSDLTLDALQGRQVVLDGANLFGVSGRPTTLNSNTGAFSLNSGNTTVQGSTVDFHLHEPVIPGNGGLFVSGGGELHFESPSTLVTMTGAGDLRLQGGGISASGAANVSMDVQQVRMEAGTFLNFAGPVNLTIQDSGEFQMRQDSALRAVAPGSLFHLDSGQLFLQGASLQVATVNVSSSGAFLQNATLGVAGQNLDARLTTNAGSVTWNDLLTVRGNQANVQIDSGPTFLASGAGLDLQTGPTNFRWTTAPGAELVMEGGNRWSGAGPVNLTLASGGNLTMGDAFGVLSPGGVIQLEHPSSRLTLSAANVVEVQDLRVPNVTVSGAQGLTFWNSTVGVAELPSRFQATAGQVVFAPGSTTHFQGASSVANVTATGGDLTWEGAAVQGGSLTLQGQSLRGAGGQLGGTTVVLSATGEIDLGVASANALTVSSASGDILLAHPVEANQAAFLTPQALLYQGNPELTAITAHQSLHIQAGSVFGTFQGASATDALVFATDAAAQVRLDVTGPNQSAFAERAGSLYYRLPQSPDVQLQKLPASRVDLIYEGASGSSSPSGLSLSAEERQELTRATAQSQLQLGNLPGRAWGLLDSRAESRTGFSYLTVFSPTVETATLDPAFEEERRRQRELLLATGATLQAVADDEDLPFWRQLVESILLWEDDEARAP